MADRTLNTLLTSLIKKINGKANTNHTHAYSPKLTTKSFTKDNISVATGTTLDFTIPIANSGYTPVAIAGWDFSNASSSGVGCSFIGVYQMALSGSNVAVQVR